MVNPRTSDYYLMKTSPNYAPHSHGEYTSKPTIDVRVGHDHLNSPDTKRIWSTKDSDGSIVEYMIENYSSSEKGCPCGKRCRKRLVGSSGSSNTNPNSPSYSWSDIYDGDCKCRDCGGKSTLAKPSVSTTRRRSTNINRSSSGSSGSSGSSSGGGY